MTTFTLAMKAFLKGMLLAASIYATIKNKKEDE